MANQKKNDPTQCLGCPKPIIRSSSRRKPGDEVVEIQIGLLMPDEGKEKAPFHKRRVWGRMHLSCFRRAIGGIDLLEDLESILES